MKSTGCGDRKRVLAADFQAERSPQQSGGFNNAGWPHDYIFPVGSWQALIKNIHKFIWETFTP